MAPAGFDKLLGTIWSANGARRVKHMDVLKTIPTSLSAIFYTQKATPKGWPFLYLVA